MDEKGVLFCSAVDEKEAAVFAVEESSEQDDPTKMPIKINSLMRIDPSDPYGVKEMPARYVAVATDKTLRRF